jgi:hypothetical protein
VNSTFIGSTYRWDHGYLHFYTSLVSVSAIFSSFIQVVTNYRIFLLFLSIPLHINMEYSLSIHQVIAIYVDFISCLLWMVL